MSDVIPHKDEKKAGPKIRDYETQVVSIEFAPDKPTRVGLKSGKTGAGTCLGCADAPCITKDAGELALPGTLDAFPGDPSLTVCPTKAIDWDQRSGFVSVDSDSCIGCGICVVRCPFGAISLTKSGTARIATADQDRLTQPNAMEHVHPRPKKSGKVGLLSGKAAARLAGAVGKLADQDRNLLVRNLMHEAGMSARVRRRGDMNMRMDAVGFTRSKRLFVAEIELVGGELESPRALMEDVAILHARYGFEVADIDALSVILAFPNLRSEYYQVIRDINKVLGIKCRTLTIGALLAVIWIGKTIDGFKGAAFSVEEGGIDLAKSLDIPGLTEPYQGAFRPAK